MPRTSTPICGPMRRISSILSSRAYEQDRRPTVGPHLMAASQHPNAVQDNARLRNPPRVGVIAALLDGSVHGMVQRMPFRTCVTRRFHRSS
jgi:hypothetical protein